jgi:predicted nucleic acid-binding protein
VIVLDASATIELLLNTKAGSAVAARLVDESLHAPHLLDVEVAQVLRRWVRAGDITGADGADALEVLAVLDIERYDHVALLPRIWALRDKLTAYDAAYVALAEGLGARLLTTDARLAKAPSRARVEVVRP